MGDGEEEAAVAPTEMAGTADAETQSVHAWAFSDYDDEGGFKQPRTFTLSQIVTVAAVVVSLMVVVGAAVFIGYHLREAPQSDTTAASSSPSQTLVPATLPPRAPASASALPPLRLPPPTTITVRAPAPAPSTQLGGYTTSIKWSGAGCIDIRFPDADSLIERSSCDPSQTVVLHHTARGGQLVGADPIMGQAVALACRVVSDGTGAVLVNDSGTAGDGHDINCIIDAP